MRLPSCVRNHPLKSVPHTSRWAAGPPARATAPKASGTVCAGSPPARGVSECRRRYSEPARRSPAPVWRAGGAVYAAPSAAAAAAAAPSVLGEPPASRAGTCAVPGCAPESPASPPFIPGHPLIAGFPANPVLPAQLGNRPLVFEILSHKLHPFIHRTGLFPGHRPFLLALLCTCHLCSRSICYLCTKSVPPLPLPRRGEREGGVRGLRSHQFFHAISGTLHWTPTHLLSYRYGAIGQGKRDSLT
jgi:hypothetical protein